MSDDEDDDNTEVSSDASGKTYLLVSQTNYDQVDDETYPLTYLQLGAYPTWGDEKQRGDDLLTKIGLTSTTTAFFKDDFRSANGKTAPGTTYTRSDGNATTTSTASALTSELMTRGGIRLHTDGNYVSTTRGDRVDVIFGNYQLAVLGRSNGSSTDSVHTPAFWESSGGHTVSGDVAMRERTTLVEWNADRTAWRAYRETLKGNHIERFQGLAEEVFECETLVDRIGPAIDGGDETASIPATTAAAHQQTDAADHWVNPSSGPGTGWPRAQETPDVTETMVAKKLVETKKVRASLGEASGDGLEAGSFHAEREIESERSLSIEAASVHDRIYAEKGAEVAESIGVAPDISGGEISDWSSGEWTGFHMKTRAYVARYGKTLFDTRHEETFGSANFKIELVALDIACNVGVTLKYTDMSRVDLLPGLVKPGWYKKSGWVSGHSASDVASDAGSGALKAIGILSFGRGETTFNFATPTFHAMVGARASVRLCAMSTEVFVDHLDVHPEGSHTEIGIAKATIALVRSGLHAVKQRSGLFHYEAAGLSVRS